MMQHASRALRLRPYLTSTIPRTFCTASPTSTPSTHTPVKLSDFERQLKSGNLFKSKNITSQNDWKRLSPNDLFSEMNDKETRGELKKLQDVENEVFDEVSGKAVGEVDWDYWESEIRCPDLVMTMKKHYEGLELPDFEGLLKEKEEEIDGIFDPVIKEVEEFGKNLEGQIGMYEERLMEVEGMKAGIEDVTVESWLDKHPEVRKEIESDVENHRWFLTEPENDAESKQVEGGKPAVLTAKP